MGRKKHLIVVGGPTASGKTSLAIRLAQHYRTVILSADSRQFFREMSVGTAKPTPEERRAAPHFFIDHKSVTEAYSVGDFERDALALLENLYQDRDLVILVGGSGLYIKAVCEGLDPFPAVPAPVRESVKQLYQEKGLPALQQRVRELDPEYYAEVDLQNPQRLMRAIAVCLAGEIPFSHYRKAAPTPRPFLPIYLEITWPRAALYRRIERRVEAMLEAGLVEEARKLYPLRAYNALQTVGYAELFKYFDGATTLEAAVALIKQNTRRYAKRQGTWMRRQPYWKRFGLREHELAIRYVEGVRESSIRCATYRTWPRHLSKDILPSSSDKTSDTGVIALESAGQTSALFPFIRRRKALYFLPPIEQQPIDAHGRAMLLHQLSRQVEFPEVAGLLPALWARQAKQFGFEAVSKADLHPGRPFDHYHPPIPVQWMRCKPVDLLND